MDVRTTSFPRNVPTGETPPSFLANLTRENTFKGIRKVSQKVVQLHHGYMTLLCDTDLTWGIFFDKTSFFRTGA